MKAYMKKMTAGLAAVLMTAACAYPAAVSAETAQRESQQTAGTVFSIGSVSKMYAAAAAMQLADSGKLDLDAPLTEYLPEFRMNDPRYRKITVRMLMNHRAGLMGSYYSDDILFDARSTVPHDALLDYLSRERLKADPGAYGAYCNDGFELLEQVVERVSGEDFTAYVENHITKPLGLSRTGTPWNLFQDAAQTPVYHERTAFTPEYGMTIGEGGMLATVSDLCAFGSAFFTGNKTLLSESAKNEMRTRAADDPYEDGFGLGWDYVSDPDYDAAGVQVVSKGGDLVFQHAELLVAPDEEISVAVSSAGGSSSADTKLARALMDIALEEKGITVTHSAPARKTVLESVPAEYTQYAGQYALDNALWEMTFPQNQYLRMECLSDPHQDTMYFLLTDEDCFVQVYGDPARGQAVQPAEEQNLLRFTRRDGTVYLLRESISGDGASGYMHTLPEYYAQQFETKPVSDEAQAAWDARNGRRYYLCSDSYASVMYAGSFMQRLTVPAAGNVNCQQITDSTHAQAILHIPSSLSRDQSDLEIITENGAEYLALPDQGGVYLCEDDIPLLPDDLQTVELTSGAAVWYNIGSTDRTVTLDIPANAAVYVYDRHDRMTYSSYMKQHGSTAALPKGGKIVFIGEDGGTVGLN